MLVDNSVPHVVYDLTLPLEERRKNAISFRTGRQAAQFLGIKERYLHRLVKPGKRIERNGKLYAVRIKKHARDSN